MSPNVWSLAGLCRGPSDAPWRLLHPSAPLPVDVQLEQPANPMVLCRHSDGVHFAMGDQAGYVSLWTLKNQSLECILRWKGHEGMVKALTWCEDQLISAGRDGTVALCAVMGASGHALSGNVRSMSESCAF